MARTLEREWEAALRELANLKAQYARHQQQQPRVLSAAERSQIEALALEVPALWAADSTTPADRKAILRLLVEEVVTTVEGETEWVDVVVRWTGGRPSRHRLRRPVARLSQLARYPELLQRLRAMRSQGHSAGEIATALNAEGWTTPTQRNAFNARLVRVMMERHGILAVPKGKRPPPGPDTWWLADLAAELELPRPTLYGWLRKGLLQARQIE